VTDKYRIDSHKLMYHIPRVNDWLNGKEIYPIYVEVGPAGACNHRCVFCALDFMGYQNRFLDTERLKSVFSEMGRLGVKSVMLGGEGEPLLHKNCGDIINHAKKCGIDTAVTTNGVLLRKSLAEQILPDTKWIKVSVNAGTKETYAKIHRTSATDFDKVIENLKFADRVRRQNGYTCTLGMQLLLIPENHQEVGELASIARDIGMDYVVVKPYSQHRSSTTQQYRNIQYSEYFQLDEELAAYNTDDFQVVYRLNTMKKWDEGVRGYERCLALPFWSYMDAGGNIWGCSAYLGDDRFLYGNIYEQSFEEIWQGPKRQISLDWVQTCHDVSQCRLNCRMDEINKYLWEIKHPAAHVNFV